jgi:hypothetical protein
MNYSPKNLGWSVAWGVVMGWPSMVPSNSFLPRPSETQADDVVGLFVYTLGDGA